MKIFDDYLHELQTYFVVMPETHDARKQHHYKDKAKCGCPHFRHHYKMYIKINRRFGKRYGSRIFQFSVIESYRENGKVRHRTLCFLDWMPERFLGAKGWVDAFWEVCEQKLSQFSEKDRKRLIARLETLVPRSDEAMRVEQEERRREERLVNRKLGIRS